MALGFSVGGGTGVSRHDVSGAVTATLVRFVRSRTGDAGVDQMLVLAGERRPVAALEEPTGWSSHDEAIALLAAASHVVPDPMIGLHVGEEMLRQHDGTDIANRLRSLGSPGALLENVTAAAAKFNTVSIMEALEVGEAHAVVRAVTRPGFIRHPQLCDFTRGLLSQVPVLFGLVPAIVSESECQARGGRFCLYSVAWEARQWSSFVDERTSLFSAAWEDESITEARAELEVDPDTRLDQLQQQLSQVVDRLEGVYATAAELLVDQDITTLLSRIVSRAAHAVSAPQYLLVVRTAPDAPVQLHQHGFDPTEAQSLANELWREHPDDAGGSRLVVDIASSRRRYGRLAAVNPKGAQFLESERQILRLYAGYAATALDVVTSLEDARRSDATARALLDFSRALSRAGTTDDVIQVLADTVPQAAGSADATVMLWDAERQELAVRARTTGRPNPFAGSERPDFVALPNDTPLVERVMSNRQILVVDANDDDVFVAGILERTGTTASVIAPLVAGDEFFGVVAANYRGTSSAAVKDRDIQARLMGLADQAVTALQNTQLLEQVSHMAWHDSLTGLPNRRLLEDRVSQELERARRTGESVSLFFVDLDRFKAVNDTMGHAAGDELIRQVASRLCDTVRRQDTVARLGGDEFAVLVPGMSDAAAIEHLAHRSLEALSAPYRVMGRDVRISGSIGIALTPDHGESFDDLLSHADEAMYRSKELGRNTYQVFTNSPEANGTGGLHLDSEIPDAIERGEFFVLYQPAVDLQNHRVVGVEALVRWQHPSRGVLEPRSFIPAAEQSDVIVALDTWVLRHACRQMKLWREDGLPPMRLAVNLASRDLWSPVMVETVRSALAETGIEPESLQLEITERVVLDEAGVTAQNVAALRDMGVRFCIDDFGTGNSSMNRIGSFPVSTLKIDDSFIRGLGPDGESASLVSAIISMAQRLGLECVAEGVETSHQCRVLLQRGCTTAQGYLFSPPLPPAGIERLISGDGLRDRFAVDEAS